MRINALAEEEVLPWTKSSTRIDISPIDSLLVMEADTFSGESVKGSIFLWLAPVLLLRFLVFSLFRTVSCNLDAKENYGSQLTNSWWLFQIAKLCGKWNDSVFCFLLDKSCRRIRLKTSYYELLHLSFLSFVTEPPDHPVNFLLREYHFLHNH